MLQLPQQFLNVALATIMFVKMQPKHTSRIWPISIFSNFNYRKDVINNSNNNNIIHRKNHFFTNMSEKKKMVKELACQKLELKQVPYWVLFSGRVFLLRIKFDVKSGI
eukprot:TRINITY_DN17977_c0_g1_i4.p5 TRINITY_DN17977_c0_g1~~TRINITY_DN17977_c0_g1_i4.p5  ORF type:complete len:108 (-),score=2.50 TRINITY_DN17977_c0_g1_i4:170-493(-)